MKNFKRIGAALLVLVMIFALGTGALADTNGSIIDKGAEGSITIHKFDTDTLSGSAGDGAIINDTSSLGTPLNGIVFTITLLPDTANSGTTVAQAKQMVADMESDGTLAANQQSGTTGSGSNQNGEYIFSNLDVGIYLVEEQPNSAVESEVEAFLVSIPMMDPANSSGWLYDVHVYPKNTTKDMTLTKEIRTDDSDASEIAAEIGDTVEWVIKASIPADISSMLTNEGYFHIKDELDSRLTFESVTVNLVDPDGDADAGTYVQQPLADGTDYTLTNDNGDIKIDFNKASGITELTNALAEGWMIEILVSTTINQTAAQNLSNGITNGATLTYNNSLAEPDVKEIEVNPDEDGAPTITVTGIAIFKIDSVTKGALNGAVFTIYETEDDAKNGEAIKKSGVDWSKESGTGLINGVAVDGYIYFSQAELMSVLEYNDVEEFNDDHSTFYFVETEAPTNYALFGNVVSVTMGETVTVENVEIEESFTLPITGGSGTLLFTIIGIVLIAGAVTLLIVSKKRRESESK